MARAESWSGCKEGPASSFVLAVLAAQFDLVCVFKGALFRLFN